MGHLQANGFDVTVRDEADLTATKDRLGVPPPVRTCHTALIGGYVVEGHVPATVIDRLLGEKPRLAGIAVPGMPLGSPGMEGSRRDPYDVLAFDKAGTTTVYTRVK